MPTTPIHNLKDQSPHSKSNRLTLRMAYLLQGSNDATMINRHLQKVYFTKKELLLTYLNQLLHRISTKLSGIYE